MKKLVIATMIAMMISTAVTACPQWECQLMPDDWSCGGVHGSCSGQQVYDETIVYDQYIYCPYCGHEMWDCICGSYQESYQESCGEIAINNNYCDYQESYCDYQTNYGCGNGYSMSHWANVRDCYGNIIGQVGYGSSVEVCGTDPSNPGRVMIYDYNTGTYGSVLSECIYGGYQWDGSGDNGYYNQYQGEACYQESYDAYDTCDSYTSCGYVDPDPCSSALVRYTESYQVVRQWEAMTGACNSTCWR